ncbi:hypothetical protein M441DRAFT_439996 [Trichoderma asperellum CBS 433.97]|uniref:Secreted protein n=1 Tax=Trichoderma asperellum (strain ATCC 204424 / CBS 433.97 / NBRC 101777) TaxID=1042311 RepID=A0A2T3Z464_TRIA4|nr:hypothetical protein M441DRAFT_439996 [Trichoderma asperellum CBS 433.97]PTB39550.1 hypothetical protein M441DRAFT_439996 [Trichoderma asperellum CBS 433.97]
MGMGFTMATLIYWPILLFAPRFLPAVVLTADASRHNPGSYDLSRAAKTSVTWLSHVVYYCLSRHHLRPSVLQYKNCYVLCMMAQVEPASLILKRP